MNEPRPLSPRERQMVQLLAHGHSNKQIARQIRVSENTVKFHLKNAYRKLCVGRRIEAAAFAGAVHQPSAP